ncbi:hypothetical protein K438DRAFT_1784180 [Mycena galopus ATCC 62051]|nr:hypothetical protein K438DRAFT_1784180 [Mycena galopus ATCC 62051]
MEVLCGEGKGNRGALVAFLSMHWVGTGSVVLSRADTVAAWRFPRPCFLLACFLVSFSEAGEEEVEGGVCVKAVRSGMTGVPTGKTVARQEMEETQEWKDEEGTYKAELEAVKECNAVEVKKSCGKVIKQPLPLPGAQLNKLQARGASKRMRNNCGSDIGDEHRP